MRGANQSTLEEGQASGGRVVTACRIADLVREKLRGGGIPGLQG